MEVYAAAPFSCSFSHLRFQLKAPKLENAHEVGNDFGLLESLGVALWVPLDEPCPQFLTCAGCLVWRKPFMQEGRDVLHQSVEPHILGDSDRSSDDKQFLLPTWMEHI